MIKKYLHLTQIWNLPSAVQRPISVGIVPDTPNDFLIASISTPQTGKVEKRGKPKMDRISL
jgi:hypothetical protein